MDNAKQPQTPVQIPTSQPEGSISNQRGNVPIIIGVVLLLLVVGGGVYFLGMQKSNSASYTQQANLSPTPTTENAQYTAPATNLSSNVEQTTNWKTYTSTKANYSFKYPTEWPLVNVLTFPECTVCVENIDFTPKYNPNSGDNNISVILVFKEDKIKTLEDYVNIHVKGDTSKVDLQYTTVGAEKAVSYKLSGGIPPLPVIEYAVVKNGMYYIIRLDDSAETNKNKDKNLMIFNEMLSTFKFQ